MYIFFITVKMSEHTTLICREEEHLAKLSKKTIRTRTKIEVKNDISTSSNGEVTVENTTRKKIKKKNSQEELQKQQNIVEANKSELTEKKEINKLSENTKKKNKSRSTKKSNLNNENISVVSNGLGD